MKPDQIVLEKEMNGDHVVIRVVDEKYIDQMHQYINELSQEETFISLQNDVITKEDEDKAVKAMVQQVVEKRGLVLILFVNDVLAGISNISSGSRGAIKHRGGFGISLRPQFRGKGYGRLLMETILDITKKHMPDLEKVTLTCFVTNENAKALYKKLGFVEYGRLPEGLKRKGKTYEEISMYKDMQSDQT